MKNEEVSGMLSRIADYLEFEDGAEFRVRAYRRAALSVSSLSSPVEELWKQGRLREIPGVGEAISEKIDEFLKTGSVRYLNDLQKETPVNLEELRRIGGLGPKTIAKLYVELGIKNVKDLEKAARQGKIENIKGFGEKVQSNILKAVAFSQKSGERALLGTALPTAELILEKLRNVEGVKRAAIAGSIRRMKETIGDIDILVTAHQPAEVMKFFTGMLEVRQVLAHGDTKSSVILTSGLQVDLRVLEDKIFGAGLLYFSGSKEHNVALRKIAIANGLKLSEYGLFEKGAERLVAGKTEEEIYRKLGLQFIPPELREGGEEMDAAFRGKIPELIGYDDMKGDLQIQTQWSDGDNTIEEYARAALKRGYEYICVTDHVGGLAVAHALNAERLKAQRKEIDAVNKKVRGITVLQGCEVNITAEGKLDMPDAVLKELDVVLAAIHSGFKNSREQITKRMMKAMENEHVDIIAHPTGRLLARREAYEIDMEKVIDKAKETGTVLEIDAFPNRLDLKDMHARMAVKKGVKVSIDTDSHAVEHLEVMRYGIGTARRGWVEKKDVINEKSLKDMLKCLKNR